MYACGGSVCRRRTVIPNRWRAASVPFHYAHAPRWTRGRAAAQLRR
jgi:hypothetical protein